MSPLDITAIKLWKTLHIELICTYNKTVKQIQLGSLIKEVDLHLTCKNLIDPFTGWFDIA